MNRGGGNASEELKTDKKAHRLPARNIPTDTLSLD